MNGERSPDREADEESALWSWTSIPHYYGNTARQLLLGAAVIMLGTSPFYADSPKFDFFFEVLGAIVIVAFAAFTNPWRKHIVVGDAIISGVGLAIFEIWALSEYGSSTGIQFVLRQAIAILFIFAFYFSLKTLRAMLMQEMGALPGETPRSVRTERRVEIVEKKEELVSKDPLAYEETMQEDDRGDS